MARTRSNPSAEQTLLTALGVAMQIVFAIVFVLIQFVAIFWYLSRSREETILSGQTGTVTLDDYWGQPLTESHHAHNENRGETQRSHPGSPSVSV